MVYIIFLLGIPCTTPLSGRRGLGRAIGGSLVFILSSHSSSGSQAATSYKCLLESSSDQGHIPSDNVFFSVDTDTVI